MDVMFIDGDFWFRFKYNRELVIKVSDPVRFRLDIGAGLTFNDVVRGTLDQSR